MAAEWKGSTPAEYQAFKAQQRAEQIADMQAPLRDRRSQLEALQASITEQMDRLRADPESDANRIAALEREWATSRQVEVKLIEDELVVNKAVENISRQSLT